MGNYKYKLRPNCFQIFRAFNTIVWIDILQFIIGISSETTIDKDFYYQYNDTKMKQVCYYAIPKPDSWDKTLQGLSPGDINPELCTHINIAFAKIKNGTIAPGEESDVEIYNGVLSLKQQNPNLKVLVSVNGGFKELVTSIKAIDLFAYNAAAFLKQHGFDGLDLDWEFPSWPLKPGNRLEKERFTYLVMQLSNSLRLASDPPFLLSIAVAAQRTIVRRSYEVEKLVPNLDYINLMGYDFSLYQSYWPFTGYNSPLHKSKNDFAYFKTLNIESSANYFVSQGVPRHKLVVGMPTYGRTWKLFSFLWNKVGAPAVGPGMYGGYVTYPQTLELQLKGAVVRFDQEKRVPYSVLGREWVSHENRQSIFEKAKWIKENGFGGVMTWNLNCDDVNGTLSGRTFDLHNVIKEVIAS